VTEQSEKVVLLITVLDNMVPNKVLELYFEMKMNMGPTQMFTSSVLCIPAE
jgi:hypothetical protein